MPILPKISTFSLDHYTKKRFLLISPKISIFEENDFFSIISKISKFRGKLRYFEITLRKKVFCPYFRKYQHFLEIIFYQNDVQMFFGHIFENFFRSLRKNVFFCPYVHKYQHFEERTLFWDHFEITLESRFLPISPKISTFETKAFYLDLFEKFVYWPYVKKYQHFEEKDSGFPIST